MKRLLAFLALLAGGMLVLLLAIGDEPAVKANSQRGPKQEAQDANSPPGVETTQGSIRTTVAQSGPIKDLTTWRDVPAGDGRMRREEVFVLNAEDSKPIAQGLQQLDFVTVALFDAGKHTSTFTARQAFVEMQRDANGQVSIREGKTFDLRDAVYITLPGSRMAGLRLDLGNVIANLEDDVIVLHTQPDQSVQMTIEGEHQGTLRGKGLQARLPRDQNSSLHRTDIEILTEPVLESDGLLVQSAGRLHYVEDTISGAAQITLDDAVRLDLSKSGVVLPGLPRARRAVGDTAADTAVAQGDQFTGWLTRLRTPQRDGHDKQEMVWQRLLLTGAPAIVEVPGGRVETPRISVLPGLTGEPFLVTAFGGESRLQIADLGHPDQAGKAPNAKPGAPILATAQRRTHLVRPVEYVGSIHRAYGFPTWSLRALDELQIVVCEGRARLDNGDRTIDASDGVRVFRRDGTETGIVEGLGAVRCTQRAAKPGAKDLIATGNDGFVLTVTPTLETLRLGPLVDGGPRWREHHFTLDYGAAHLEGRGACSIAKHGERSHLTVQAPGADVTAHLPDEGIDLTGVIRLDAEIEADELQQLTVDGLPAETRFARNGETLIATAPRLLQIAPRSLRLLPVPTEDPTTRWPGLAVNARSPILRRDGAHGEQVELRGPQLDVHHAGGRDVILDAIAVGDDHPHVYARLPQPAGREPTTIACEAQRLRLFPFVMSPQMRTAHLGGSPGLIGELMLHTLSRPWLVVDEVIDFQLDDAEQGHCEGRAHELYVSQGAQAALFVGNPDTGQPAFVRRLQDRREVLTEGARVRVFQDDALRLQALASFADRSTQMVPTVTLHELDGDGLLSHMRATCRGNIEVLPDAVTFGGPVLARSIHADGSEDPDGVRIDAGELRILRVPATGEIAKVKARKVQFDMANLKARGDEVELDLRTNLCIVRDPDEAYVEFGNGFYYRAPRLEVNYKTFAFRSYFGTVGKLPATQAGHQ